MQQWHSSGVATLDDIAVPDENYLQKGVIIIECMQEIPCNPCVDSCPFNAISMDTLNDPPVVDYEKCVGCGNCVSACPGLAIFLTKHADDMAYITLPYELLPVPKENETVRVFNREGKDVGTGIVTKVRNGKTILITVGVAKSKSLDVRHLRVIP